MDWAGGAATKQAGDKSAKSKATEGLGNAARKAADPNTLKGSTGQPQRGRRATSAFKGISAEEAENQKKYKEALKRNARGARGGRWRGTPKHDEL